MIWINMELSAAVRLKDKQELSGRGGADWQIPSHELNLNKTNFREELE